MKNGVNDKIREGALEHNIFLTSDAVTVMKDLVKYIDVEKNHRVLFVDTAGELISEETIWISEAKSGLENNGFEVVEYTITDKTQVDIQKALRGIDIIYVAGGQSFYLLDKAQKSGFIKIVQKFMNNDGGIYIGQSAGCYLAGPDMEHAYKASNAELADKLDDFDGLSLVDFRVFPHFGSKDAKKIFLEYRCEYIYEKDYKIILLRDNQYIRVQKNGMYRIEEVK